MQHFVQLPRKNSLLEWIQDTINIIFPRLGYWPAIWILTGSLLLRADCEDEGSYRVHIAWARFMLLRGLTRILHIRVGDAIRPSLVCTESQKCLSEAQNVITGLSKAERLMKNRVRYALTSDALSGSSSEGKFLSLSIYRFPRVSLEGCRWKNIR